MAVRRAWYRSAEYKQPMGAKILGDKSIVQVIESATEPGVLILTREYPWNFVQEIKFSVLPNGETKYLEIGPGPASPVKSSEERKEAFEKALVAGEVRIQARGAVPGQGISNTRDDATGKDYATSEEFEREYAQQKIDKMMKSDFSTRHISDAPAVDIGIRSFDASRPDSLPPLPRKG